MVNTRHVDDDPSFDELKLRWAVSVAQFQRDFAHCRVLLEENRLLREHSQAIQDETAPQETLHRCGSEG
jgi:hypothetical protein